MQVNERIRDPEVRVIGPDGDQLGIMTSREALNMAFEMELDLVKISPNAVPPVCKIIDFGKYRYELLKKEKEQKKNQKQVELKEIRMTPNIDTNDLNTKISAGKKFLEKGHKLKVTIRFRGREMAHMKDSEPLLADFAEKLSEVSQIEKPSKIEGRNMSLILAPKK
ncbi:MAG: translation initiation factor IF-3 [Lachnospiraceae bacterium]|nr:translation initiation factor IF-3 [Lachnospiraceae bacterium]